MEKSLGDAVHRALAEDDSNLWFVGAILVLFGTVGQNLGNNIVSVAHQAGHREEDALESNLKSIVESEETEKDENNAGEEKTWVERHLWAIGTFIFVSGSLCNFVSFGYAAQSLLASLQSVQFLSNMLFAKVVHKETLTWTMIGATFVIICGNVLVVLFSEHTAVKYTGAEIFNLYATNTAFHAYLGIMGSIAIGCEYTYRKYNHSRTVKAVLLPYHSFLEPACYCLASSFVGTLAIMNAKCLSMYLTGGDAGAEFQAPPLYLALLIWLTFVTFWFKRMDHGLDLFPPLFFIPVLMISFVFVNILCGGIFFLEFEAFDGSQYAGFCCGAVLILSGVYFLAPPNTMELGPQEAEEISLSSRTPSRERTYSNTSTDAPKRRSRRYSFSSMDSDDPESVTSEGSTNRLQAQARPRVSTMSHPLAALKEAHRRASQVAAFASAENYASTKVDEAAEISTRQLRRISAVVGMASSPESKATALSVETNDENPEANVA